MNVTNIKDYRGYCIQDSTKKCIVQTTHIPMFGCESVYARIWHVGIHTHNKNKPSPDIRLITEL